MQRRHFWWRPCQIQTLTTLSKNCSICLKRHTNLNHFLKLTKHKLQVDFVSETFCICYVIKQNYLFFVDNYVDIWHIEQNWRQFFILVYHPSTWKIKMFQHALIYNKYYISTICILQLLLFWSKGNTTL